jgi:hypothetical protein
MFNVTKRNLAAGLVIVAASLPSAAQARLDLDPPTAVSASAPAQPAGGSSIQQPGASAQSGFRWGMRGSARLERSYSWVLVPLPQVLRVAAMGSVRWPGEQQTGRGAIGLPAGPVRARRVVRDWLASMARPGSGTFRR